MKNDVRNERYINTKKRYYSGTNYYGQTSPYGSGSSYYKVIWLNTNDNLDYKTSNACTTPCCVSQL